MVKTFTTSRPIKIQTISHRKRTTSRISLFTDFEKNGEELLTGVFLGSRMVGVIWKIIEGLMRAYVGRNMTTGFAGVRVDR